MHACSSGGGVLGMHAAETGRRGSRDCLDRFAMRAYNQLWPCRRKYGRERDMSLRGCSFPWHSPLVSTKWVFITSQEDCGVHIIICMRTR